VLSDIPQSFSSSISISKYVNSGILQKGNAIDICLLKLFFFFFFKTGTCVFCPCGVVSRSTSWKKSVTDKALSKVSHGPFLLVLLISYSKLDIVRDTDSGGIEGC